MLSRMVGDGRRPKANGSGVSTRLPLILVNELFLSYWRFANSHYLKDGKPAGTRPSAPTKATRWRRGKSYAIPTFWLLTRSQDIREFVGFDSKTGTCRCKGKIAGKSRSGQTSTDFLFVNRLTVLIEYQSMARHPWSRSCRAVGRRRAVFQRSWEENCHAVLLDRVRSRGPSHAVVRSRQAG